MGGPETGRLSVDEELIEAYKQMAELTLPYCKGKCAVPLSCCSPEYCVLTLQLAKEEWGVDLKTTNHPTLALMGPDGCIADPHLRPFCTLHVCSMNGLGVLRESHFGPINQEATEKYFQIRIRIEELEYKKNSEGKFP
jgi:hypothetical protein